MSETEVKSPPGRVWIKWDDAYPWEFERSDGTEYVRADTVTALREQLAQVEKERHNLQVHVEERDSLLDSQAAEKSYAERTPIGIHIAVDVATSMRSRCVEKVKEMAEGWLGSSRDASDDARSNAFYERCNAAQRIAEELESLPLEQGEQEKRR